MSGEELITSSILVKIMFVDKIRLTSPPNPEKRGHAAAGTEKKCAGPKAGPRSGKPNYGAGPITGQAQKRGWQDKFGGAAVSQVFC